ncbi:SDR family NAD(P)-dependent oxidoreductase [Streptomyces chartreusis]|uniref:SDR family NAD(P)-dependent oxidoreductase n=1 Tax=Streptomyces chartreusis TaxID=1969 RepID=UPI003823B430
MSSNARHQAPILVYSGVGSQWSGMGRNLMESSVNFRSEIDRCAELADPMTGWSLRSVLAGDPDVSDIMRPEVHFPALFAFQVGLTALWRSRGLHTSAVLGHSAGEAAAAYAAGALGLEDSVRVAVALGNAAASLVGTSAMLAVRLSPRDIEPQIEQWSDRLEIAAANSGRLVVVAGDPDSISEFAESINRSGIDAMPVPGGYGMHCRAVETARHGILDYLAGIRPEPGTIPLYSSYTGDVLDTSEMDAQYWYRCMRYKARFDDAIVRAFKAGHSAFFELSPHPLLSPGIEQILDAENRPVVAVGAIHRNASDLVGFESSVSAVYAPPMGTSDKFRTFLQSQPRNQQSWVALDAVIAAAQEVNESVVIDPHRTFAESGFDSMAIVQLSNRLAASSELRLPSTVGFDYPTPLLLADHIVERAMNTRGSEQSTPPVLPLKPGEPVAIVAAAGRWPGGATSPETLGQLLRSGRDAIGPFPEDRGWDLDELLAGGAGRSITANGGFLYEADEFDAAFFGIGQSEADAMDPQQRLVLETAWELLERAGIIPAELHGSQSGVFVGAMAQEYGSYLHETPSTTAGHALTGTSPSVISGRVAYALGLSGPAITVDTACSSSLVAIHLAVQALRRGEVRLALAGGVAVMARPGMFTEFTRQKGLAPDGRCKPFASAADGTAWSEAVGLVLLERFSDAVENGREILAVIRGSSVNQDGSSNGLSAPNGAAQERVIRQALDDAGLLPQEIDVVEAHGTGTPLGDPIEASALLAAYGQRRNTPVLVGSAKSCLGHTQAAAGVTGLISIVESMRTGDLPPLLNFDRPTPYVDWSSGSVSLVVEQTPWPATGSPRRAAVSSFGISGTNAHVVVEQPPPRDRSTPTRREGSTVPWVVSARTGPALAAQAAQLAAHAADMSPHDVARSLAETRTSFEERAVVVGAARPDLLTGLRDLAGGRAGATYIRGTADVRGKVVFVFPGQGAQWSGMAAELLRSSECFADRFMECEAALAPFVQWSPSELLRQGHDLIGDDVVQPVLWAVMVSLAEMWKAHGLVPDAVVGHSQGEIAAACVANALPLAQGAKIVALRSRALRALAGRGRMASLQLTPEEATVRIGSRLRRLSIAAVNGPASIVISGDSAAVKKLVAECRADRVQARLISVDYASHSPQVAVIENELREILADICPQPASLPFFSTVTADWIHTGQLDGAYWYQNLRNPVQFMAAIDELHRQGHDAFIEVSPHPLMTPGIKEILADTVRATMATGTLHRGEGGLDRFTRSLAEAYSRGLQVDWAPLVASANRVALPTYPFQRARHWVVSEARHNALSVGQTSVDHQVLGAKVPLADGRVTVLTGSLSLRTHPWLNSHAVRGSVLLPAAAFIDLAWQVSPRLADLSLDAPLIVEGDGAVPVQVMAADGDEGTCTISISSRCTDGSWTRHAVGTLAQEASVSPAPASWPPPGLTPVGLADFYEILAARGYDYGPSFRTLRAVWRDGDDIWAEVQLPEGMDSAGFCLHPALVDGALQAIVGVAFGGDEEVHLPHACTDVTAYAAGIRELRVRITPTGKSTFSLVAFDSTGGPVFSIGSIIFRAASVIADRQPRPLALEWMPCPPSAVRSHSSHWLLWDGKMYDDLPSVPIMRSPQPAPEEAQAAITRCLGALQHFLADPATSTGQLAVVTRQAMAVRDGEGVSDLAGAALWGLIRTAQIEHPGQFKLIDIDERPTSVAAIEAALTSDEMQLAIRDGKLLVPRLRRPAHDHALSIPPGPWMLTRTAQGGPDAVALLPCPEDDRGLGPGQVEVQIRAAGLNFKDVLVVLGVSVTDGLGLEGAGVVTAVGPGVTDFTVGDRVMGLTHQLSPVVVADHRVLAKVPSGWSFAQSATTPVVFLTAHYSLIDLACLKEGERVLIHAATGGVGAAAVQLARLQGAEVFGTASPGKQHVLEAWGLDKDHIASSRDLDFEDKFGTMDVVLNTLAGEFIDASLRMLGPGGRFIELGKTDPRDGSSPPGYHAFDLLQLSPDDICTTFEKLSRLFEQGALQPVSVQVSDVRHTGRALKRLSQARHVGKLAVSLPRTLDPEGTVLIAGGTGTLGALAARRLVQRHGVKHLVLVSRSGPNAPGAQKLRAGLAGLGAEVTIVAADVADMAALAAVVRAVPAAHPLTGVVLATGVMADASFKKITAEQMAWMLAAKAKAAWNLHELTLSCDLAAFIMYSSAIGVLGNPGQAGYGAANAFLDGLAHYRRSQGLPAVCLAWGLWAVPSSMTATMTDADRARMTRSSGLVGMTVEEGLTWLDQALDSADPVLVPARLSLSALSGDASPTLRTLAGGQGSHGPRGVVAAHTLEGLAALAPAERLRELIAHVRQTTASILGRGDVDLIRADDGFLDCGLDSLGAVELRNRLSIATGLKLASTLTFDWPTPRELAQYLADRLAADEPVGTPSTSGVESLIAELEAVPTDQLAVVAGRLEAVVNRARHTVDGDIDRAEGDELLRLVDDELRSF